MEAISQGHAAATAAENDHERRRDDARADRDQRRGRKRIKTEFDHAFQPAWQAAPNRTAAKTNASIRRGIASPSFRSSSTRSLCYAPLEGLFSHVHDAAPGRDRAVRGAQLLHRQYRLSGQAAGLSRLGRHHPVRAAAGPGPVRRDRLRIHRRLHRHRSDRAADQSVPAVVRVLGAGDRDRLGAADGARHRHLPRAAAAPWSFAAKVLLYGIVTGIVSAIVSAPVVVYLFGGVTGSGSALVVAYLHQDRQFPVGRDAALRA